MQSPTEQSSWLVFSATLLAGVVAGLQVGKVPPALPLLQSELGISLVTAGWVISVFNLTGASLGFLVGQLTARYGSRRMILCGLVLLLSGAVTGAFATSGSGLIGLRILSGLGFVAVAVAAPRVIVSAVSARHTALALGIWGVYFPAGIALGMLIAPLFLSTIGWRGFWLVNGVIILSVLLFFEVVTRSGKKVVLDEPRPATAEPDPESLLRRPLPWVLFGIFLFYSAQFSSVMSWLPTILVETGDQGLVLASLFGAFAVSGNIIGNLFAAWLLHRKANRVVLLFVAYIGMACGASLVFAGEMAGWLRTLAAFQFAILGGFLPASLFASSAVHARVKADVARINGGLVQGSNLGNLIAPPLVAAVVTTYSGWQFGRLPMLAFFLAGVILVTILWRLESRAGLLFR